MYYYKKIKSHEFKEKVLNFDGVNSVIEDLIRSNNL
jgi:hypothetical protein